MRPQETSPLFDKELQMELFVLCHLEGGRPARTYTPLEKAH